MPQGFARKRSTFRCYRQKLYGYTKNKSRFCAGFAQTRKRPMPSAVVGSGNRTSPRPAPDRPGGAPNSSRRHQRQGFPYGGVCSSMRSDTHANIFSGAPPHLPKRRRYGWGTPSALRVKDPIVDRRRGRQLLRHRSSDTGSGTAAKADHRPLSVQSEPSAADISPHINESGSDRKSLPGFR